MLPVQHFQYNMKQKINVGTLNNRYVYEHERAILFTIKIFNLTKNKTAHAKGRQNVSGSRWLINFPVPYKTI